MRSLPGISFLALLGLSACSVGPDFTPPKAEAPPAWSGAAAKDGQNASGVVVASSEAADWWKSFNDAELTSLIDRARDSNLDLQQAGLRIEEARAQLVAVGARDLPTASFDNSYARSRLSKNGALDLFGGSGGAQTAAQSAASGIPSSVVPFSLPPFDLFQSGFDATWEIDVFGRVRRSVESAEAQAQAIAEQRNDVMISVYAEVARDYIQLRGVQRLIDITNSNLKAQRDAYKLTHAQAQGGETSNLDVENASSQVATTEAQLPTLEDQKTRSINALSYLLALEPDALRQELDTAKPMPPNPPHIPIGLPADLARRRPDIRRTEAELHAATANIGVARADLYPRLTLSGSIGLQALRFSKLGDWASRFYNFGPSLSIPVFNGVTYANISLQEVRQKESALAYKAAVLGALHEVENAVSSYGADQLRQRSLVRAADADARALSLAEQRYKAGLSSFLDVLDAERRTYSSQSEVERTDISIITDLIAIYKALGGGWNADSGSGVASPVSASQPASTK